MPACVRETRNSLQSHVELDFLRVLCRVRGRRTNNISSNLAEVAQYATHFPLTNLTVVLLSRSYITPRDLRPVSWRPTTVK